MNQELLRRLQLQAGGSHYPDINPQMQQKFAELIVKECMKVALEQKKWVENQEVFNSNDEAWNRARIQQSQHIVDKIKQHFGVE